MLSGTFLGLVTLAVWLLVAMVYLWHILRFRRRIYLRRARNYLHLSHALIVCQIIGILTGTWQLAVDRTVARTAMGVGIVFGAGGLVFYMWAKATLGAFWDRHASIQANHRLARTGPYAWCRHPIYLGQLGLFVGAGLASLNGIALICCAPALWSFYRRLRTEEKLLAEHFGTDYKAYQAEVPCFWPIPQRKVPGDSTKNGRSEVS